MRRWVGREAVAVQIPFVKLEGAVHGRVDTLSPLVRRVIAPNPGPFTYTGTGTYIIGRGRVAVIDPGPQDDRHLAALRAALAGETVEAILITHTHMDHSPLAGPLKAETGAATYGFGPHPHSADGEKVEEGGDHGFVPDRQLTSGDGVVGPGWHMTALHTPGHISNHLCFALAEERALFTGDHVMGWSTTVISPPDGDMADYMANLTALLARDDRIYYPTHGAPVTDPKALVSALITHRREREDQILAAIDGGLTKIGDMVPVLYAAVDKRLYPAASRSVLAHLEKLKREGIVRAEGDGLGARWQRVKP